jgi:hypothetical protein
MRRTTKGMKYIRHGHCKGYTTTPVLTTWRSMIQRCYDPNSTVYYHYGAKGIGVCDRWRESFLNFLEDMGDRPKGCTLDRIDGSKGYYLDNCRWATKKEQARNRKSNRWIEANGSTKLLTDWASELGCSYRLILRRINAGWSEKDAVTKPVRFKRKSGK